MKKQKEPITRRALRRVLQIDPLSGMLNFFYFQVTE